MGTQDKPNGGSILPEIITTINQWVNWNPKFEGKPKSRAEVTALLDKDPNTATLAELAPYEYSKRPIQDVNKPHLMLSYKEAMRRNPERIGFVPQETDPILLIDIDHCGEDLSGIPEALQSLLDEKGCYQEFSPSGEGLRAILYLESVELKQQLKARAMAVHPGIERSQIQIKKAYGTFTHNVITPETDIKPITLDELSPWFNMQPTAEVIKLPVEHREPIPGGMPNQYEIERILRDILLLDQNPRLKRGYESVVKEKYAHYDYWRTIAMCLSHWGVMTGHEMQALEMWIAWSLSDPDETQHMTPESYTQKWSSFKSTGEGALTVRTLIFLAKAIEFDWPKKIVRNKEVVNLPNIKEYVNFEYLLDHYNIQFTRSLLGEGGYLISCDQDIFDKYFSRFCKNIFQVDDFRGPIIKTHINIALRLLAMDCSFANYSRTMVQADTQTYLEHHEYDNPPLNPFKQYILTPAKELPEALAQGCESKNYTLDYLFDHIKFQTQDKSKIASYYKLFRKCMMQMMKHHFYTGEFDENNLMLVLQGPERSFKSTFLKFLIPPGFRQFAKPCMLPLDKDNNRRDASKIASQNILFMFDEFEHYCGDKTFFKEWFSQNDTSFYDKHEKDITEVHRLAFVVGTTNSTSLQLGQYGTRRFCILPVQQMDTNVFKDFNWHAFYREIYFKHYKPAIDKFESGKSFNLPWVLNETDQTFLEQSNKHLVAHNEVEALLHTYYDFEGSEWDFKDITSVQKKHPRLKTTQQIQHELQAFGDTKIKLTALTHALKRTIGEYSNTYRKTIYRQAKPKCTFFQGLVEQGKYKYWYMPERIMPDDFGAKENDLE